RRRGRQAGARRRLAEGWLAVSPPCRGHPPNTSHALPAKQGFVASRNDKHARQFYLTPERSPASDLRYRSCSSSASALGGNPCSARIWSTWRITASSTPAFSARHRYSTQYAQTFISSVSTADVAWTDQCHSPICAPWPAAAVAITTSMATSAGGNTRRF